MLPSDKVMKGIKEISTSKREASWTYSPWIDGRNLLWEKVLHLGNRLEYPRKACIAGSGDVLQHLFYLHSGEIQLMRTTRDGNERVLWLLGPGNLFGEIPYWDGLPMDSQFLTRTPCVVYAFSRQVVENQIFPNHADLVMNLLDGLASKTRVMNSQVGENTLVLYRLCQLLIHAVKRQGEPKAGSQQVSFHLGLTQQEIARILGVHRVTLHGAITELKDKGIVSKVSKSWVQIERWDDLLNYAKQK